MADEASQTSANTTTRGPVERRPFLPHPDNWDTIYEMLCGHCAQQAVCQLPAAIMAFVRGKGPWPENAWVTDPGAGCTCLSYRSRPVTPLTPEQRAALSKTPETELPHVCGGCAARKGSDASVALHTQRDYRTAVKDRSEFTCHEDPENKRLCGGWCRAVQRRELDANGVELR